LDRFTSPLNARYGVTQSAQDYIEKSQLAAYEGQRAMFEGYSRNKYISTGVIQWMLNNAFSEMIWHLYDSYLVAGGGFYGSKIACEPIHIMYSYNDGSIWVVNSLYEVTSALQAQATVYNLDGTQMFNQSAPVAPMAADSATELFVIPSIASLTSTYFLRLTLTDDTGAQVSNNFYWLSTVADVPDFDNSTWFNTPCTQYADFTLLQKLPEVTVTASLTTQVIDHGVLITTTVSNPNPVIAFFIHLTLINNSTGANILPVFWDDNYITLLPHETRVVNATVNQADLQGAQPGLLVDWWNDGKDF